MFKDPILDPPGPERKEAGTHLMVFPSVPSSPKATYVREIQVQLEFHVQPLAYIIVRSCKREKEVGLDLLNCPLRTVGRCKETI